MPIDSSVLGFTNRWYKEGAEQSIQYKISDAISIRLMSFTYFIAAKLEAHNSRNPIDLRSSKDFEDIVYCLDNRLTPLDDFKTGSAEVKKYLRKQFQLLLQDPNIDEGIFSHLERSTAVGRARRIKNILESFPLTE